MSSSGPTGAVLDANDRLDIQELLCSYGVHHDGRDFDSLLECFTDDATYTMTITGGETYGPREGRMAIVEQIRSFKEKQTDQRRHVITNFGVRALSPDECSVTSYVTVLAVSGDDLQVITSGAYTDRVVRTSVGWRIADKKLTLDKGF